MFTIQLHLQEQLFFSQGLTPTHSNPHCMRCNLSFSLICHRNKHICCNCKCSVVSGGHKTYWTEHKNIAKDLSNFGSAHLSFTFNIALKLAIDRTSSRLTLNISSNQFRSIPLKTQKISTLAIKVYKHLCFKFEFFFSMRSNLVVFNNNTLLLC